MSKQEHSIKSQKDTPKLDTSTWPLLLKNYDKLAIRTGRFTPIPQGHSPLKRPIEEHLKYGIINLDKPANPSSHEVVSWIRKILNVDKTGHSGTLDPKVTGCLLICINRATRLAKSQQTSGKEYIAILKLNQPLEDEKKLSDALNLFQGALFQRPPEISAVVKKLRIRSVYKSELFEFNKEQKLAVFSVSCEAGTYIRTLCEHLGLMLGTGGKMEELRRVRSGALTERDFLYTLHDVLDAKYLLDKKEDESYIRRVIKPMELLLRDKKKLVVKDTAVNAICYGAQLMIPGLLRFENGIEAAEEIVLITTKGEAVAIAYAVMTSYLMSTTEYGVCCKTKRVLMDRDVYPKKWGLGVVSTLKKKLIKKGKLDKYGNPNENTPDVWLKNYTDVGANKWYYLQKKDIDAALGEKSGDSLKPKKVVFGGKKEEKKEEKKVEKSDEKMKDDSDSDSEKEEKVEKKKKKKKKKSKNTDETDEPKKKKKRKRKSEDAEEKDGETEEPKKKKKKKKKKSKKE